VKPNRFDGHIPDLAVAGLNPDRALQGVRFLFEAPLLFELGEDLAGAADDPVGGSRQKRPPWDQTPKCGSMCRFSANRERNWPL
jgi:hypothetical protein